MSIGLIWLRLSEAADAVKTSALLATPSGRIVYGHNETAAMIPASTLKLVTSLAALEAMGPDHRFKTLVAYDPGTQKLFVRGLGDPLLISEQLDRMSREIISQFSPEQISGIVLDGSFFGPDIIIPGTGRSENPYDATTGALCANFNTVHFTWSQSTRTYGSAESQTPFVGILEKEIRASGLKRGRVLLSPATKNIYAGLLLGEFLKKHGVMVTGGVVQGDFLHGTTSTFTFKSAFTLAQVVEQLLTYSNNFIANQILLILGAETYGEPATLEKGLRVLTRFINDRLGIDGVHLVEGSGLSRKNRISARQMLSVLNAFAPYYRLLRQSGNDFYKTGTLSDVRSRAGYFMGADDKLYPYVIMLNSTSGGYETLYRDLQRKAAQISRNQN